MKTANSIALILILAASSVLWVESTSAQPTSKPVTPEFTVKYIDNSYDIPPSYTTDSFTGRNVSSNGSGEHIDGRSVVFTIKNQPFSAYTDASGDSINLSITFDSKATTAKNGSTTHSMAQ